MGVQISQLIEPKEIEFIDLKNKKLAVDSFNMLYQFLSTIRQRDGSLLKDSHGNVTSHLAGLFSRTINLMKEGMRLVFVFDGEAPELKKKERERRSALKHEAQKKYEEAAQREDMEDMKKYASRTSQLTPEMIHEAKDLIQALGCPIVQAPGEGEAQASYMARKGDVYALISQDTDCLLFGSPRMIKNLTITQKKKKANKLSYETIKPQMLELDTVLKSLGLTGDQLIVLGMLVGTDYNIGGIKGIGPQKALKLVKSHNNLDALFAEAQWDAHFSMPWKEVFDHFKNMKVTDDYELKWENIDKDKVIDVLCNKHDFSKERIMSQLEELEKAMDSKQKGLGDFF